MVQVKILQQVKLVQFMLMKHWMNSKGHRKNILGDYKYIGVGVVFGGHYKIYYTQNFYI